MAGTNLPINSDGSELLVKGSSGRPLNHPASIEGDVSEIQSRLKLFRSQSRFEDDDRYHDSRDERDYGFEPDHSRGRGCLPRFLTCRCMGCGCLIFLLLFTLFAIYVVWQRPPFIWEPVKTWLNADLTPVASGGITADTAYADLNAQVTGFGVGINTITITEAELQAILRDKLVTSNLPEMNVDIEADALKIYWNADSPNPPLWMIVEINTQDKTKVKFNKIGTQRIALPPFLNDLATSLIASALKFGANKASEGNLLDVVFTAPENVTIQEIKLEKDQLQLKVDVKNGLDNVFGN